MSKVKLIKALQSVDNFVEYFAEERTQTIITDIRASIENSTTLRDQFAMSALQGLIAHHGDSGVGDSIQSIEGAAQTVYEYADAMLKARECAE